MIQNNVVVIPKSTHKERMKENFNIFDFKISNEDMTKLTQLDEKQSLFFSYYNPETVEFLTSL